MSTHTQQTTDILALFGRYFVFPKYMLSQHFWNEQQRQKYLCAAMEERTASLSQLHTLVESSSLQTNREVTEVLARIREQVFIMSLKTHQQQCTYYKVRSVFHVHDWLTINYNSNLVCL